MKNVYIYVYLCLLVSVDKPLSEPYSLILYYVISRLAGRLAGLAGSMGFNEDLLGGIYRGYEVSFI